jgi:hypothetical protein
METQMTRKLATLTAALALIVGLGVAFAGSASAKPNFPAGECVLDDGYNRIRPCSGGDGSGA